MANVKISELPEASAGTVLSTDTIVGVFNGITKKCKLSSINLDVLSDGTTYKRIQAAKANAINGGTFDAASVLNFGIGQSAKLAYDADFNTLLGNGIYITYDGANRPDINYGILFCGYNSTDDGYGIQLYFNINGNGVKAYRKCAAGVWGSWITF